MTAYNVINPGSMAAGQPEDVSQVLANFQAIAAILTGNVDGANLKNFPNDATKSLRGDMTWKTSPQTITTSTLASGPPGGPVDGDIWIATAADANGARWAFQYNAGSGSSSKWEFIGGSAIKANVDANETTASAAAVDLTTVQSITLARAGDYDIHFGCHCYHDAAASSLTPQITKAGVVQFDCGINVTSVNVPAATSRRKNYAAAAADVLKMQYATGGGANAHFLNRYFEILPIRIA